MKDTALLEYTRTKEELEPLLPVEERERVGRDLHDAVIQRLFATGLELQALASRYEQREPDLALGLIAERARELVDADVAVICVPRGSALDGLLSVRVAAGASPPRDRL